MRGPPPKKPELLQRPKRVSTKAVLRAGAARRRVPPLPKHRKWQPMTKAWWRDVWHSPMAAEFVEADKHGLYRLAVIVDAFWAKPSANLAAEVRLAGASYGLDPIARRRLQWTVAKVENKRRRTAAAPNVDPRERLRVLK